MTRRSCRRACAAASLILAFSSCGYHVAGKADLVPKSIQTIAIPAFVTTTSRYKLVDTLPQAIATEFLTRTRFRIVNDQSQADAVLHGSILRATANPNVNDPNTGVSISIRVNVVMTVSLVERSTGKVLYTRSNWTMHQDYAAAVDPHQLFDESGPALDRLDRDVARDIVSAVVENF
jgi:PBP1b-binding outer membrane lipoprotein LpoB